MSKRPLATLSAYMKTPRLLSQSAMATMVTMSTSAMAPMASTTTKCSLIQSLALSIASSKLGPPLPMSLPLPGSGYLLALVRVTKSPRSAYDALMLQLHDRMKGDDDFQGTSPQSAFDFPAGSTWMAFTDEVSHAATAGQYQLEQTFLLPVGAMQNPQRSPLRVLEKLKGRRLV